LVSMHSEGWRIRALSRHFKMGRNTVRRILRKHRKQRDEGHDVLQDKKSRVPRQSKLDPFKPLIKELLEKFPNITAQRVYEELCVAGYEGGISILRDRLQAIRPQPSKEPIIRFETESGHQGQMNRSSISGRIGVLTRLSFPAQARARCSVFPTFWPSPEDIILTLHLIGTSTP
jgi:transposase